MKTKPAEVSAPTDMIASGTALHHQMLSWLTVLAIVMTLTSRRWTRAVEGNTQPPKQLVSSLKAAMKVAKGLDMPANLQVRALKWAGESQ